MPIEISTQIIHASYAAVINSIDPNANIYDNPNQQGTAYPAWFIVHRAPVEVQRNVGKRYGGNRYTLTYMIDIWYMIQQNIPRLYDQYTQVAEELDSKMDYLPIHGSDAVVHVYDRSWSLELNCLKYSTTLRLRVYRDNPNYDTTTIDVISTEVFLKTKFPLIRVYFTNVSHPELSIEIPSQMFCYFGDTMVLPTIEGVYRDAENHRWQPVGWTLGGFGETIGPLYQNTTTNLIVERVYGYDASMGGTIGEHSSTETTLRMTDLSLVRDPDYQYSKELDVAQPVLGASDLSLVRAPDYQYSKTLDSSMPVYGGTVEPWTPSSDLVGYFPPDGATGLDVTVDFTGFDANHTRWLKDASGNYIEKNSTSWQFTITGMYKADGTSIDTSRYSLRVIPPQIQIYQSGLSSNITAYKITYTETET